jgi:hypothetical protein
MHGKSVSPLIRVVRPQLSAWYQIESSQTGGVSPTEMKSQASSAPVTMNSLAPIPSNRGMASSGIAVAARPCHSGAVIFQSAARPKPPTGGTAREPSGITSGVPSPRPLWL